MQIFNTHGDRISFCLETIADEGIAYQRGHIFVGEDDYGEFDSDAFDKLMDAIEARAARNDWDE